MNVFNKIFFLKYTLAYLSNLSFLNVGSNGRLKDLPAEIKYLKKLNCLDVSGSGMQRLREELSLCYSLVAIHGNASKIKSIPTTIGNLKLSLFSIYVVNSFQNIPSNFLPCREFHLWFSKLQRAKKMVLLRGKISYKVHKSKKENLISGAFSYSGFIMKCIERAHESSAGVEFAQGS